jgi:urea transporter
LNKRQTSTSEKTLAFKASDVKDFFLSLAKSYAHLFFLRSTLCGFFLLLVTFLNYNAGFSGILAVFSAYLTAYFLGYHKEFLNAGYYAYNSLLVGLAIGFLFKISALSLLMIFISGGMTFFITLVTATFFSRVLGLQVLSVPFIIVSTLVYLSASSFTNLYVVSLYVAPYSLDLNIFNFWFSGYLKSLGAIIFMPNEVSGLIIAILILYYSRILFVLSLSGFLLGISLYGLFIGSIPAASNDISSFNYILIAMAIGGIFNIPSIKSFTIAMLGVAIATLIASAGHVFWSQYGLPIFTLPFTLVTLSFLYAFNVLNYPNRTTVFLGNPEENLEYFISNRSRFVDEPVAISLPFSGRWHSWQGFDGRWTHQGLYKYAYDFVISDSSKQTFMNQGHNLSDYYCFGQEVLSPINGKVIQVINHIPDNDIGAVDSFNIWGNEVIIQDSRGFFVKLAHLSYQSITVFEGQSVGVGTFIGLCGNSGNSPQPHLHIQVQSSIFPTAPTIPFVFVNYGQANEFIPFGLPEEHHDVTQCSFNLFYDQVSNFVLDDQYTYDVYLKGELVDTLNFHVKMSDTLSTYFETSRGKLYFGKQYGNFYAYSCEGNDPYLKLIYLALSTMPVSYVDKLVWQDNVSNSLILNKWQLAISSVLNLIDNGWVNSHSSYQYKEDNLIIGKIKNSFFDVDIKTSILLDPNFKFKEINVADYQLLQVIGNKTEKALPDYTAIENDNS